MILWFGLDGVWGRSFMYTKSNTGPLEELMDLRRHDRYILELSIVYWVIPVDLVVEVIEEIGMMS